MGIKVIKKPAYRGGAGKLSKEEAKYWDDDLKEKVGLGFDDLGAAQAKKEIARTEEMVRAHEKKRAEEELTRQRRRGTSRPYGSI